MLKLYHEEHSAKADAIEAEFRDMILGYDRELITSGEASRRFGAEHSLPIITNNGKIASGDSIPIYIAELKNLLNDWQAFQGDWCYVNAVDDTC